MNDWLLFQAGFSFVILPYFSVMTWFVKRSVWKGILFLNNIEPFNKIKTHKNIPGLMSTFYKLVFSNKKIFLQKFLHALQVWNATSSPLDLTTC